SKNPFPFSPRWRSGYATLNGVGYVICGFDSLQHLRKDLFQYNPQSDSWAILDSFPGPGRGYAAMQGFDKRLFLFGGVDSLQQYNNDYWSYDLDTKTWHKLSSIPSDGRRGGMSCASGNNFYYTCGLSKNGRLTETWRTDLPTALDEYTRSTLDVFPNP